MQLGGARIQTGDLLITRRPALPPTAAQNVLLSSDVPRIHGCKINHLSVLIEGDESSVLTTLAFFYPRVCINYRTMRFFLRFKKMAIRID